MQAAAEQERQAKLASIESKKRPLSTDAEGPAAKRAKLESGGAPSFLSNFDFTTLPATLITDLVVANIQHFSTAELEMLVTAHRQKLGLVTVSPPTTNGTPTPAGPSTIKQPERTETPVVTPAPAKLEPVDPLKMDFDQEEMEFEPDRLNDEV
jgi:symplekin